MLDYTGHMRRALGVLGRNYQLGLPTAIASFCVAFATIPLMADTENLTTIAWVSFIGLGVSFFAQGVTMAMALEAIRTGSTSLRSGGQHAMRLLGPLLGTSIWMSALVIAGLMLFIAPGLIIYCMLFFALPAVAVEGLGPHAAFRRSIDIVRGNKRDSLMVFMWITSLGLILGGISIVIGTIPVAGQLFAIIMSAAFAGFMSVVLVTAFLELATASAKGPAPPPDAIACAAAFARCDKLKSCRLSS